MKDFNEKYAERLEKHRIRMLAINDPRSEIDKKVLELCQKLALPLKNEGSVYLKVAIMIAAEDGPYDENTSIHAVAQAFCEDVAYVKMIMHHAIQTAWYTMEPTVLEKVFGEDNWHNVPAPERFIKACKEFVMNS